MGNYDDAYQRLLKRGPSATNSFVRDQTSDAVDQSVAEAMKTTPDAAAKHYAIADATGMSLDEAARQGEQLRATAALQGFSSRSLVTKNPETAAVYSDPKLAAIGWDDLETIKTMEQARLDLKSAPERWIMSLGASAANSLEQNQINVYSAEEAFRALNGGALDVEDAGELARLKARQAMQLDYGLADGFWATAPNKVVESMLGSMIDMVGGKVAGAGAGTVVGAAGGAALAVARGNSRAIIPAAKVGARFGSKFGGEAGSYLGAAVPMVGSMWDELKTAAPDLDPRARAYLSIASGAVGGQLEKAGFDEIVKGSLKAAAKNTAWKRAIGIAAASLGEGGTEAAQAITEVVTLLAANGAFSPNLTAQELQDIGRVSEQGGGVLPPIVFDASHLKKTVDAFTYKANDGQTYTGMAGIMLRVFESAALGAVGGGSVSALGAGGKTAIDYVVPMVQAKQAKVRQAALEQVVKVAGNSKIFQRSPKAFRDAAAKMAPNEKVFVSAEGVRRFFQDGENEYDDAADYNRARGFKEQAQQASLTGADMQIDYADWIAYVAPSDFGKATMKDVRVSDPRQMTANEGEAWEKENFGGFKGVQDLVAAVTRAKDVEGIVLDHFREQAGRKGGSQEQIEMEAQVFLARAKTRAHKQGRSLRALAKDEGLFTTEVEGAPGQPLGPSLAQKLRKHELAQAVKDLRSERGPESRMPKSPVLSILARRGVDPNGRLGRTLVGAIPTKGQGSIPGFWRKTGGLTEADQLAAFEHEIFTDNALLDESGYLSNDQVRELVDQELQGRPLRTASQAYAIQEAAQAKNETARLIREAGIENAKDLSDEELVNALLEAERVISEDVGPPIEGATHESVGAKKGAPTRGSIDIPADLRGVVIRFLRAHDGSTMIHEGGHLWLEELRKDAMAEGASEKLKRDWAIIKDWLGIRRGDRISTKQSERFARAVEQYFFEGNAPSLELERPMQRFAVWFLRIYKTLRNKYFADVKLTDPVRGVLDRMLATDVEIFKAQQNRGLRGVVLSTEDGLTTEQVGELAEAAEAGRQEAEMETVRMHVVRQRKRATATWKKQRAAVKLEVTSAVDSRPDVQVSQWIRHGKAREGMELPAGLEGIAPAKFSKMGLVGTSGSSAILKVLTSGKHGYWSAEGGYDPALIADIFGYESPRQMLSDLSDLQNAGGRDAIIERMTDATMERRHGKFDTSEALTDAVFEAAANEKAIRALEVEGRALAGRTGKKQLTRQVIDRIAKSIVAKLSISDLLPKKGQPRACERYRAAAEREANLAIKAHANGDLLNMQLHRQRQMVNIALEREARQVEARVRAAVTRVSKIQNKHAQEILGKAGDGTTVFKDQTAKLLVRFGFPSANTNPNPRQDLIDFVQIWTPKGANFRIAPSLFNEAYSTDYRRLHASTFFDVVQAIESVYESARVLVNDREGSNKAAHESGVELIVEELASGKQAPLELTAKTDPDQLRRWKHGFFAALKQMEHLIDRMGPAVRELLWKPFADAEADAFDLTEKTIEPITAMFKALIKGKPEYNVLRSIPALASKLNPDGNHTKSDLLVVAFNMMNASNAEKMTKGFGWDEAGVWTVLEAELNDSDWDFIEAGLDALQSLWPRAVAQELRLTGNAPAPIQARPHTLPSGRVIKGGYFPVIYDTGAIKALGGKLTSQVRSETEIFSVLSGLQRVVTGHTHMIERSDMANAPLALNINGLPNHLQAVIHDLTHREPILRVYKLIDDERVYEAMVARVGTKEADLFAPWLRDIAQYQSEGNIATQEVYRTHRLMRARLLILTLGGRITTLMLQPLGSAAGYVLGRRHFGANWKGYHGSEMWRMKSQPIIAAKEAMAKSAMMRRRTKTYDRDYADLIQSSYGTSGEIQQVGEQAMGVLAAFQFYTVDVPLWNATYAAAKAEKGMTHEQAVDLADSVVEKSQGSGSVKNRSAFMRDRGLLSYLTMYFTYHNTLGNLLGEGWIQGIRGKALASEYLIALMIPAIVSFWERQIIQDVEGLIGIDDPDEEENKLLQHFTAIVAEPMGILPGLRDISSAVANIQSGGMFDPSTPQEQVMEWTAGLVTSTARAVKAVNKGDSPQNALVSLGGDMARLVSLYFKAPLGYTIGLVEKAMKEDKS